MSPGMSVIVFSDKPVSIQLFHFNKTYQKFATGGSTNSDPGTVQFSRNFSKHEPRWTSGKTLPLDERFRAWTAVDHAARAIQPGPRRISWWNRPGVKT